MDIKNMLRASLPLIGIGSALVVISVILQVISLIFTGPKDLLVTLPVLGVSSVPDMASTAFTYLMYPLFFVMYFWGGLRGIKRYRLDTVGSATSTAFSYVVTGGLHLALGVLLNLLVINGIIDTVRYGSVEAALATALFGETGGAMGVLFAGLCGIGALLIGALMNFVVGGVGAILAQR
jgi:hypothetical protein